MSGETANSERDIRPPIHVGEQLFYRIKILFRQANNRRAGAAEANAEQIRMIERKDLFQGGYELLAVGLMNAVMQRFTQKLVIAALHRLEQQRDALQIKDGIFARDQFGQGLA